MVEKRDLMKKIFSKIINGGIIEDDNDSVYNSAV